MKRHATTLLLAVAMLALAVGLPGAAAYASASSVSPLIVPVVTTMTPTPSPTPGDVLFDGDFKYGLSNWPGRIHPERISIVDDPVLGSARKVAKFTVYDADVGPTSNPRAQLEAPANMSEGNEYWVGWSSLLPSDFPAVLAPFGWVTLESVYGPPFDGAGPISTRIQNGSAGAEVRWQRNRTYDWDMPFRIALPRGRWVDYVWHVKMSSDPSVGFAEVYVNSGDGYEQQLLNGQSRLYMKTFDSSNGAGANNFRLANYRMEGMLDVLTVYHASPKVGTSFDAVAPHSYG
jgi:hypothetical protein